MQYLEVSCAVRRIYKSFRSEGLTQIYGLMFHIQEFCTIGLKTTILG